ncbi:MAG: hypothetical protein JKY41_09900 [Rhodobacteraceae bacterium]|nr:hypothetical protein [Paracoccaceae bacterium]
MTPSEHDWITLHRIKYPKSISAEDQDFDFSTTPKHLRFCPKLSQDSNGMPLWDSDTWCALAVHSTKAEAEAMFNAPEDYIPRLSTAIEQWHALAIPVTHRGSLNWSGEVEDNSAVKTALEDPNGPLMVVTTAGYITRDAKTLARIPRFLTRVVDVLAFFDEMDGNVRRDAFNGGFDNKEGFTLSLWEDDDAMTKTAYWQGIHRTYMDESRDGSYFDRSSFTRARIVSSSGSWDGDPLLSMS